jgi:hypothetical protein
VEILQILFGDFGDGNIIDVNLLLPDQVQQQIKRAFVNFELHHRGRSFGAGDALHSRGHGLVSAWEFGSGLLNFVHDYEKKKLETRKWKLEIGKSVNWSTALENSII